MRALAIVLCAVVGALLVTGNLTVYHSRVNGGVTFGDCYHFNVGVEVYGTPGFFVDQC